jgi:hypothetical protein
MQSIVRVKHIAPTPLAKLFAGRIPSVFINNGRLSREMELVDAGPASKRDAA